MNLKTKEIIALLSVPLLLMFVYSLMYIFWKVFNLPTNEELLIITKAWFAEYGLLVVFIGAIIEGFLLLGQYFPGGFIIFLGVISADNIPRAVEVVLIVCISFFISYTLNYWVGKYGWYKLLNRFGLANSIEKSKDKILKQGMNSVFFTYWEPNLASLTATAAGILQIPLKKFLMYSATGIILWNIFWGTLVYNLKESALKIMSLKYVAIIFLVWISIILIKNYWQKRKEQTVLTN